MNGVPAQIGISLAWAIPLIVVLIVGITLAIGRWDRHPVVSALLVATLATVLLCSLGFRTLVPILVASRGGTSLASVNLLLGILGIAMALIRTASWAALVTAVFGWRTNADGTAPAPLQFSIRGLVVVTFAVALLCGLGRALVGFLGETAPLLIQLVDDLPVVVCLGIGIWIAAARWRRHPAVSHLATSAFGLAIAVSIFPQLLFLAAIDWVGHSPLFYSLFTLTVSLASATSWALAIAAALGWRTLDNPFAVSHAAPGEASSPPPLGLDHNR